MAAQATFSLLSRFPVPVFHADAGCSSSSGMKGKSMRICAFLDGDVSSFRRSGIRRPRRLVSCRDSLIGLTGNHQGGRVTANLPINGSTKLKEQELNHDDKSNSSRGKLVEEEAWDLLQKSVVFYCGNPIGTIAANDTSSSTILNYDQVFIRDFVPSGIAFLLKGEYDIVRNFILHTLQLQVYLSPYCFPVGCCTRV